MDNRIEKIRAEIERLIADLGEQRDVLLEELLEFINSLPEEPVSEDLEEEIIKIRKHYFINDDWDKRELDGIDISNMLRHIAKRQEKKDQSTIELVEDHAMLARMEKMKEEMMAKAIDGKIYETQAKVN